MIIIFTLIDLFTWFFWQKRNNLKKKKLEAAPTFIVLSRVIDRRTAQIEVVRKSFGDQLKEVWPSIKIWRAS